VLLYAWCIKNTLEYAISGRKTRKFSGQAAIGCYSTRMGQHVTSLVDHDVTDDAGKDAVDAVRLSDYFDVDEATTQRVTVGVCPVTLDMYRRPVEGAVDTRHRAAEPTRLRHGISGARQSTTHVDVDTINVVPSVGKRGCFTCSEYIIATEIDAVFFLAPFFHGRSLRGRGVGI